MGLGEIRLGEMRIGKISLGEMRYAKCYPTFWPSKPRPTDYILKPINLQKLQLLVELSWLISVKNRAGNRLFVPGIEDSKLQFFSTNTLTASVWNVKN